MSIFSTNIEYADSNIATISTENRKDLPPSQKAVAPEARSLWEAAITVGLAATFFLTIPSVRTARESLMPVRVTPNVGMEKRMVSPQPRELSLIGTLIGESKEYRAGRSDSLLHIARTHNTDVVTLARINALNGNAVRLGKRLRLPGLHILPCEPENGVVLNIPERGVYVFKSGRFVKRYPVAVGAKTWETPTGNFRIVRKVINPVWIPPKVMIQREGIPAVRIPAGESNPIGDRWMGWSAPEVGFHSTYVVTSVGYAASHACVRLYPEAAHQMFNDVYRGMPIYSIYEPILIGRRGDAYFLSVSPDIYRRGLVSQERARLRLQKAGIWDFIDREKVRRIVARQEGFPYYIGRKSSL
jgi:L,D-transpeptidase ErfK/SrfK